MKANEILNKIKTIVGVELAEETVNLAELILDNGTILLAEKFEAGNSVFIKTEDEEAKIALPLGEYNLEDGRTMLIKEEGVIHSIEVAEEKAEVEDSGEIEEEKSEEMPEWYKRTYEELKDRVDGLEKKVAELDKKEMSEEVNEEDTKLSSDVETEIDVKPIKHNPEAEDKNKLNLYGQNRPQTTRDRVFSRIANN